jgi:hypothetical protein
MIDEFRYPVHYGKRALIDKLDIACRWENVLAKSSYIKEMLWYIIL